jgi:ParB-like chromosome segregation protein Spo0J
MAKKQKSKHDPCRHCGPKAMEDLTEDIRTHGISVPLRVRSVADQIEIVAGDAFFPTATLRYDNLRRFTCLLEMFPCI